MAHPRTAIDDDQHALLDRLREIALALPGASEEVHHGRPAFVVKSEFASFGGSPLGDTGSGLLRSALVFKADPDERPALLQDPRFHRLAYMDRWGWLALPLEADVSGAPTDWTEVAELVEASYRITAPRTYVKRLDEQ